MSRSLLAAVTFFTLIIANVCSAQVAGNQAYAQTGGQQHARQREQVLHVMSKYTVPASPTSTFIEANMLLNIPADHYVAVFGLSYEGETVAACSAKMDAGVKALTDSVLKAGIKQKPNFDFIAQNKIYGYQLEAKEVLQEKLVGYEIKKTASIAYDNPALLDKLMLAAAEVQIFDLIKVDYVLDDIAKVQDQLMAEAVKVIQRKAARQEKLLDVHLRKPAQIYAEKYGTHFPTQLYDSYRAHESEHVEGGYDLRNHRVRTLRKSQTFYFNGLDADGFDAVINPVLDKPVVQCTLYLKLNYEIEQEKAK
jgi:uncharacterized protein YggE